MRILFFTLVLTVAVWFGWGFLAGGDPAMAGSGTSGLPEMGPVPATPKEAKEQPASLAVPKPSKPVSPEKNYPAINPKDLARAEKAIATSSAKETKVEAFRTRTLAVALKAYETKEFERAARILTLLGDRWTAEGVAEADLPEWTKAQALLDKVINRLLYTPGSAWGSRTYVVKKGDSLERICKRYRKKGTPVEPGFLAAVNRIRNVNSIHPGQSLRIPTGRMSILVEKKSHILKLFLDQVMIRMCRVGLGKEESPTPETLFTVKLKESKPLWYAPDGNRYPHGHPKNPLGDYYIKLSADGFNGFGIHGTRKEDRSTIGTDSSQGCIRMYAEDVRMLFNYLPKGTKVTVR